MTYKEEYYYKLSTFEEYLRGYFDKITLIPEPLFGGMKYAVQNGGKRIRPVFVMTGAEVAGGKAEDVLDFALAIELLHNYSLVHDDLECMDNDDLRRGNPTVHKVYGEGMAVLIGDALLNEAFEVIAGGAHKYEGKNFIRAFNIFSKFCGSKGMIAGQCIDLVSEEKLPDGYDVEYLHRHKTSALLKAALMSGAALEGADDIMLSALEKYADYVGLAFQITDDILDLTGDVAEFGKSIGSDLDNNKLTYPKVYGLEKSAKLAQEYVDKAIEIIKPYDNSFLTEFAMKIPGRKK